jgi:LysM repeat protein
MYQELPLLAMAETQKPSGEDAVLHKLPPLVMEEIPVQPVVVAPPVVKVEAPVSSTAREVTVKKGDSLEKIAKLHQTTVDEIIKLNHLPSSFLKIGQVLKLPAERMVATKPVEKKVTEAAGPEYYTMKVGENPWSIAIRHHMKLDELLRLNGLNEEKARKLKPGDRLRIR